MKFYSTAFVFALVVGMVCGAAVADDVKRIASTNYVDERVVLNSTGNKIIIKNTDQIKAELNVNSQSTDVSTQSSTASTEIATTGWVDINRISKVRDGSSSSTTLVNMWIE